VGGGEVTYGGAITGATKFMFDGNREAKLEAKFSLWKSELSRSANGFELN
jgi:hypothetical protein